MNYTYQFTTQMSTNLIRFSISDMLYLENRGIY